MAGRLLLMFLCRRDAGAPFLHVVLDDSHKTVCTDGRVDLDAYCVFSGALEFLDFQMLLQPFEEEFHLPSVLVGFRL